MTTMTIEKARAFAKRILSQREKKEEQVITDEMLAHMNQRVEQQEQLTADTQANEKAQTEFDATKIEWRANAKLIDSITWSQERAFEIKQLKEKQNEYSRIVNQGPQLRDVKKIENNLVDSCRDEDLIDKFRAMSNALDSAENQLRKANEADQSSGERIYKAENDRKERIGSFRADYGRDRFEEYTNESGDLLTRTFEGGVHPNNVKFMNEELARFNRIIREATYTNTEPLKLAVEKAQDGFDRARQAMIESEV